MAIRIIAVLLLLCLSPLAPTLTLTASVMGPPASCSCCHGMRACCCRHDRSPGWHEQSMCRSGCRGTPATAAGLAFLLAPALRTGAESVLAAPAPEHVRVAPRSHFTHSPLFQRPPPRVA